jgi:hypothetical protein
MIIDDAISQILWKSFKVISYIQAIAKCLKKVIELQVPLLHLNVTEY